MKVPINVTPDGCAFSLTATLPDHAGMANLTNGVDTSLVLGSWR